MIFQSNEKFEFISVVLAILIAVLILIHPDNARATIARDGASSSGTSTTLPLTFSHTIGSGSNRLLSEMLFKAARSLFPARINGIFDRRSASPKLTEKFGYICSRYN